MKTSRFFLILIVSLTIYVIPELLFDEAMLYISGGVIGGSILELFKFFNIELKDSLMILIWVFILVGIALIFWRVNNKIIKFFLIVVLAFFLYVFDFIVFETMPTEKINYYLIKWGRVLSKGLLLSAFLYCDLITRRKQINK